MEASRDRDQGSSLQNAINVTPLADVMLVLLIIFMVVTPMITRGVPVEVPDADHASDHPESDETLVLAMKGDGTLYLNRDSMRASDLLETLSAALEKRSDKVLFLKASTVLDYGEVLDMMDLCRRAGGSEIALVTKKKDLT